MPLQGLAGGDPGCPCYWGKPRAGLRRPVHAGLHQLPEEDREELAERLAEVPGVPGAWTAGSEELLGTTGGSRSSSLGAWLELSDDRLSTLRAGDGVAEGGSERDRREAWRVRGMCWVLAGQGASSSWGCSWG